MYKRQAQLVNDEGYPEDVALSWMQLKPGCEGYEPQGESEEIEVVDDDIDCVALLDDPEIKKLFDRIEASKTVKRKLADTLRNLSLTIDVATLSIGAAVAASGVGIPASVAIIKGGGVASAVSLVFGSVLGFLNGDYKAAAIDAAGAALSAFAAGGGGGAKAAKPAGGAAKSVFQRFFQKGTAKLALLETKIAEKHVANGLREAVARQLASCLLFTSPRQRD